MKNFFKIVLGSFVGTSLAIFLGIIILVGLIGTLASTADVKPSVPASVILKLDLTNQVTEQSIEEMPNLLSGSLDFESTTTGILDLIQTIDRAANDPSVKFIYMNLTQVNAGVTHLEEIRAALSKFRESGKPVIAYADDYSQASYYLASVSDKIFLNPSGSAALTGISMSTLFFKDLLDNLGVDVQLIRHGKFKAAGEQFISNKMSAENREQLSAYANSVWSCWSEAISVSRGISVANINSLADNLAVTSSKSAVDNKLVDGLLYKDQLIDTLVHFFGVKSEKELKMIDNKAYSKATHKTNLKVKDKVAVVYANGDIINGDSDENIASEKFVNLISKIRLDSTIKAVVLRVNSPGGSATSSEMIERELKLLREKKPVIVSMGDYAASGGYWIAVSNNKIFTNKTTITGSIGVFSMAINLEKTLKNKIKINPESVNTNKHSDFLSGMRALNSTEVAYMQSMVEDIYVKFIDLVANGRSLTKEQVDEIAQGRIWSGSDAVNNKLADNIGGISDGISAAALEADLKEYRIVEYPVQKSTLDKLMESLSKSAVRVNALTDPVEAFKLAYKDLSEYKGIRTMTRVPFTVSLN